VDQRCVVQQLGHGCEGDAASGIERKRQRCMDGEACPRPLTAGREVVGGGLGCGRGLSGNFWSVLLGERGHPPFHAVHSDF
jgi:hypothetical protein